MTDEKKESGCIRRAVPVSSEYWSVGENRDIVSALGCQGIRQWIAKWTLSGTMLPVTSGVVISLSARSRDQPVSKYTSVQTEVNTKSRHTEISSFFFRKELHRGIKCREIIDFFNSLVSPVWVEDVTTDWYTRGVHRVDAVCLGAFDLCYRKSRIWGAQCQFWHADLAFHPAPSEFPRAVCPSQWVTQYSGSVNGGRKQTKTIK